MQINFSTFDLRLSNTSKRVHERLGANYEKNKNISCINISCPYGGSRNFILLQR